ncbi:MAG: DUF1365 domain-containing protein [Opitutaceae bacterium]|jgi:hypothetical protein
MNSRLYECHVMHARFLPKPHRFVYRIFMLAVDLDELPALDRRLHLFSFNGPNLYSFREADFLPTSESIHNQTVPAQSNPIGYSSQPPRLTAPCSSLKARVLAYLAGRGVDPGPGGRIELVTLPRILGYLFNPVSFYFCYDRTGACVASIAEVTNTFHEMKPFFLGPQTRDASSVFHLRTPKNFYVSPYSDVDVDFDFNLRIPGEKLSVQIDDYVGADRTLTSTLAGPARPLTDAALAWFLFKYPLLTLRVIALIHWHALLLHLKKIPWFPKAARAADQRDLYRPHASLSRPQPDSSPP